MKKPLHILIFLLASITAFAQSPDKMTYQSVVRDGSGDLVTSQSVGIKVSIIQYSTSGTVAYSESHSVSTNANGLATIEVGTGTILTGSMSAIDWSEGPYFMKSETDPTGGSSYTIVGTSQLLSVPFALYANDAGHANTATSLVGGSGSSIWSTNSNDDVYYLDGNVGIGTNDPNIINFANSGTVLTILTDDAGAATIEMVADRSQDDQAVGWINYINDDVRVVDLLVLRASNGTSGKFVVRTNNGGGGLGAANMTWQFQITEDGDVFLHDSSNGIIMVSPNGSCWKTTVNNSGNLVTTSTTCPQ